MFFNATFIANFSDFDDKCYEAKLARRHTEMEALLREQKDKEQLKCQAQKKTKIVEQKRLEKKACRKQKEEDAQWKKEECQKDLAYCLEVDCIVAIE